MGLDPELLPARVIVNLVRNLSPPADLSCVSLSA